MCDNVLVTNTGMTMTMFFFGDHNEQKIHRKNSNNSISINGFSGNGGYTDNLIALGYDILYEDE
ncbi:MAG: hypothetical protein WA364_20080 [Candidatus Nitrosopolaris sp.]